MILKMRLVLCSLGLVTQLAATRADWPHWRGPNLDGSTEVRNLPTLFSKTESVRWVADLPGTSAATPIVWGDAVFLNTADASDQSVGALCLDRKNGQVRWKRKLHDGDKRDDRSNYASSSPTTDGRHVWFFSGNGELVCWTVEGEEVWRRNLQRDHGQFAYQWTPSTSPLLHGGKLYLQILQRDVPVNGRGRKDAPIDSYILAVNPETGKDLWKHVRPAKAAQESLEAFSSPVVHTVNGQPQLLIVGGDDITGHDPASGRELWRWGTWNPTRIGHWRLVPSPVAGAGVALACGPKGAPVFAVKLGQSGQIPDSGIAWQSGERDLSSDVSTPLFYRGRFYIVNSDKKKLFAVDAKDGRIVSAVELATGSKVESSPTAADGKLYLLSHNGTMVCVAAEDTLKVLHSANFADDGDRDLRSSVAISHDQLFVRTGHKLYCLGK